MTLINANLSKEIKEFLDVLGEIKIDPKEDKAIDFENKIATSFREVGKMLETSMPLLTSIVVRARYGATPLLLFIS